MFIKKLNLHNFRNYETLELKDISPNRVVLIGDNAQGKTNLLEAVSILAYGNSYRTNRENEVIRWSNSTAGIYTEFSTNFSTKELSLIIRKNQPKTIKVDGQNVKRMAKFIGHLKLVIFSAEDLQLVKGAPAERRKFLDKLLVQVFPNYYHQLQVYNKILQQRNHVLKQMKESGDRSTSLLEVWDQQIVDISVDIYNLRWQLVDVLTDLVAEYHQRISGNTEKVRLSYVPSVAVVDKNLDKSDNCQKLLDFISANRHKEIIRGQSLYGPHRDDLDFFINDKEAKLYASQGQQRTLVLALKLGEIRYIREKTGETPLLLLDDVMAELDPGRQKQLLELVGFDTQTFITTTHLEDFSSTWLDTSSVLKVNNGFIEAYRHE